VMEEASDIVGHGVYCQWVPVPASSPPGFAGASLSVAKCRTSASNEKESVPCLRSALYAPA